MSEKTSTRTELQAQLLDRVPGLTAGQTLFSDIINRSKVITQETTYPNATAFMIRTDKDETLRIRLLKRVKVEKNEIPLSHLLQVSFSLPDAPPALVVYRGNIGGGGYFTGDSSELYMVGTDQWHTDRTTNQALVFNFQDKVASVTPLDSAPYRQQNWRFDETPPSTIELHRWKEIDQKSLTIHGLEGLSDDGSSTFGFHLETNKGLTQIPIVLPKQLRVV